MALTYYLGPDGVEFIPVTEATPLPVSGGGGGVESAAIGSPEDAAWNGSDPSCSLISIMKAIHGYQALIAMEVNEIDQDMTMVKTLLNDIKVNTTPGA